MSEKPPIARRWADSNAENAKQPSGPVKCDWMEPEEQDTAKDEVTEQVTTLLGGTLSVARVRTRMDELEIERNQLQEDVLRQKRQRDAEYLRKWEQLNEQHHILQRWLELQHQLERDHHHDRKRGRGRGR